MSEAHLACACTAFYQHTAQPAGVTAQIHPCPTRAALLWPHQRGSVAALCGAPSAQLCRLGRCLLLLWAALRVLHLPLCLEHSGCAFQAQLHLCAPSCFQLVCEVTRSVSLALTVHCNLVSLLGCLQHPERFMLVLQTQVCFQQPAQHQS